MLLFATLLREVGHLAEAEVFVGSAERVFKSNESPRGLEDIQFYNLSGQSQQTLVLLKSFIVPLKAIMISTECDNYEG